MGNECRRAVTCNDCQTLFATVCASTGPNLVDSIINVLQKKLDDKALELLCSLYSRSTVKLTPQDIAFIQPKSHRPKTRLHLPIPELFKESCQALSVYFLQLLETFTIKPLYSSPEAQHFKVITCTGNRTPACKVYVEVRIKL